MQMLASLPFVLLSLSIYLRSFLTNQVSLKLNKFQPYFHPRVLRLRFIGGKGYIRRSMACGLQFFLWVTNHLLNMDGSSHPAGKVARSIGIKSQHIELYNGFSFLAKPSTHSVPIRIGCSSFTLSS